MLVEICSNCTNNFGNLFKCWRKSVQIARILVEIYSNFGGNLLKFHKWWFSICKNCTTFGKNLLKLHNQWCKSLQILVEICSNCITIGGNIFKFWSKSGQMLFEICSNCIHVGQNLFKLHKCWWESVQIAQIMLEICSNCTHVGGNLFNLYKYQWKSVQLLQFVESTQIEHSIQLCLNSDLSL